MATKEIWKTVPGHKFYEVSNLGRARSKDRLIQSKHWNGSVYHRTIPGKTYPHLGRILKGRAGGKNSQYLAIAIDGKNVRIHALVMLAFVGPRPNGMMVCHNNGLKLDNRLENLRYDTPRGNVIDRTLHGTDNKGERHPAHKLTEKDVRYIRETVWNTANDLARKFDVSISCIKMILSRRRWEWL